MKDSHEIDLHKPREFQKSHFFEEQDFRAKKAQIVNIIGLMGLALAAKNPSPNGLKHGWLNFLGQGPDLEQISTKLGRGTGRSRARANVVAVRPKSGSWPRKSSHPSVG